MNTMEEQIEQIDNNKIKKSPIILKSYHNSNILSIEIGIDEVGRGPLFGRVYAAAVILPKDDSFDHYKMKDSKKFKSSIKIKEVSDYIKQNALAWSIQYETEQTIDSINILQATQNTIHKCIHEILQSSYITNNNNNNIQLIIDGNYFKPFIIINNNNKCKFEEIPYTCIIQGDNQYSSIAAASILAKVERDNYIEQLCIEYPTLKEHYNLHSNKGYGTKHHLDGIKKYGITQWHRKSFGICKNL